MSVKSRLAERLLSLLAVDPVACINPEKAGPSIRALLDEHNLNSVEYLNPVEAIHELGDDPDTTYVWTLSENASGEEMQRLAERIYDANGGEPRALHMFIRDVDELQKFDYHEVEHEILPWLVQAKKRNNELQH